MLTLQAASPYFQSLVVFLEQIKCLFGNNNKNTIGNAISTEADDTVSKISSMRMSRACVCLNCYSIGLNSGRRRSTVGGFVCIAASS